MINKIFEKHLKNKLKISLGQYELPNGEYLQDLFLNNEEIFDDLLEYISENVLNIKEDNSFEFTDEIIPGIKNITCEKCHLPIGLWRATSRKDLEEIENVSLIKEKRKILPL
jgi:hypothetical protein